MTPPFRLGLPFGLLLVTTTLLFVAGCGESQPAPASTADGASHPETPAPALANSTSASDAMQTSQIVSPDRTAAEWVFGIGGEVKIDVNGQRSSDYLRKSTDLPEGPFDLVLVHLENNNRVSDDGLAALVGVKKLESLNLNGTRITSKGLAHVGLMSGLKYINLRVSTLGDADLEVFHKLPELYALEISSTQVGDAGLEQLKACKSLRTLYVSQTNVTDDGVASLKAANPEIDIKR